MAKILVVNSSGRAKSNSTLLGNKVAEGARANGNEAEVVDIGRMDIKSCKGCEACLAGAKNHCVIDDDMRGLYASVIAADVIVFSSPIYWFNLCGQIKQFIDRLFAVAVKPNEDGKTLLAGKKLATILVYGDEDPYLSGAVNAIRSIQDVCRYSGAAWGGALYTAAYDQGVVEKDAAMIEKAVAFGKEL